MSADQLAPFLPAVEIASAIAVALTAFLIYRDLRENTKISRLSSFTAIERFIGEPGIEEIRQKVRTHERLTEFKSLDDAGIDRLVDRDFPDSEIPVKDVRFLALKYNMMGFILRNDKKLRKELVDWHGYVMEDIWLRIRPYIVKKWPDESKQFDDFKELVKESKAKKR